MGDVVMDMGMSKEVCLACCQGSVDVLVAEVVETGAACVPLSAEALLGPHHSMLGGLVVVVKVEIQIPPMTSEAPPGCQ